MTHFRVGDKYKITNARSMGLGEIIKNGDIIEISRVDSDDSAWTKVQGTEFGFVPDWVDEGFLELVNPTKKIMYCVDDVLAAAKYLSRNNTLLDQEPEEIYQNIIRDMHLCVKEDWEKTSVGGYTVTKSYIDDDLYECSVTVSPNFNLDLVYTTEEVV